MRTANLLFSMVFATATAASAQAGPDDGAADPAAPPEDAAPRRLVLDDPIEISGVRPEPGVQFVSGGVEDARRALESLLADGRTSATGALVSRPADVAPIVGVHARVLGAELGDADVDRALAMLLPTLSRCHRDAARTSAPVERLVRVRFVVDVNGAATHAKADGVVDRQDPFVACVERAARAQPWPKALTARRALTLAVVAGALPPSTTTPRR